MVPDEGGFQVPPPVRQETHLEWDHQRGEPWGGRCSLSRCHPCSLPPSGAGLSGKTPFVWMGSGQQGLGGANTWAVEGNKGAMGGGSSPALAPGLERSPPTPGPSQLRTTSLEHNYLWDLFLAPLGMGVRPDILGESSKPQPPSHQFRGERWHFPHDSIKLKHPHGKIRGQEGTGDTVAHRRAHVPCSTALWAVSVGLWPGPRQPQRPLHPSANSSSTEEQQGQEGGGLGLRTKDCTDQAAHTVSF